MMGTNIQRKIIVRVSSGFAMLLMAVAFLGACGKQEAAQVNPATPVATASAQVTPAAPAAPAPAPAAPVEALNAQQFVSRASKIVKENPIKPEWPFIVVEGTNLNLAAHPTDSNLQTLIQAPLTAGQYQLKTSALLAPTSQFPVEFSAALLHDGRQTVIMNKTFKPDETVELDQAFQAPAGQCELALSVKMAPGAANNFAATLYLRDFTLARLP